MSFAPSGQKGGQTAAQPATRHRAIVVRRKRKAIGWRNSTMKTLAKLIGAFARFLVHATFRFMRLFGA